MSEMDAHFRAMLEAEAAAAAAVGQPRPAPGALPVAMVRAGYRQRRLAQDSAPPAEVATRELSVGGGEGPVPARLYAPAGVERPSALLVYFHGGGFVLGDLDTHDGHCRRLAVGAGVQVLAVDYRLAPEHPFPAAHDDALAATRWAVDHAAELGVAPERIAVGGDSAGGNLAASVAIALADDERYRPAFQLLLYPVIWPAEETASRRALDGPVLTRAGLAWFDACLAARQHPKRHRALLGTSVSRSPALVVTAGFDPLKDEGRDFAAGLAAAGTPAEHIEHPALIHDFFVMPDVSPAVGKAVAQVTDALRQALSDVRSARA